jgi:Carbohydrate esterase 2 N-terminal/Secretion system C-terminal sorting domain/GDSL-like Lipase/Acylhydrolase
MKNFYKFFFLFLLLLTASIKIIYPANIIPADNPNIQYFGRWDFSNPAAPTHSWPGVYIYAEFEGTSIGMRTNDNACWYNVFIDDTLFSIFHGTSAVVTSYTLKDSLPDGNHKILITLRGETSWTKFSFNGFILDDGKNLITPPAKPIRRIEFIGDSYTSASGNEWTGTDAAPSDYYTNIYKGFGSIIARHYNAQYNMTSRGGIGLVHDWQDNYSDNLPDYFDRTLFYTPSVKWDFSKWVPNLVVICLGLNDFSGWEGYAGPFPRYYSELFKERYHEFLSTVKDLYPGVKILCVAANDLTWLKQNISEVVEEENSWGYKNVFFTYFPYYSGEYVNSGHPNTSAHQKIADKLISVIDTLNAWVPYNDTTAPRIINIPDTAFNVNMSSYNLTIKTDKNAALKYSTNDKPYDQMENVFTTTGGHVHSVLLSLEQNRQYTFYIRAVDAYGNAMDSSAIVNFMVDTTKDIFSWKSVGYDVTGWGKGYTPLGNDGSPENSTEVSAASTVYFRHSLMLDDADQINDMRIYIAGHDGDIIYLNGHQVGLININPNLEVNYNTFADSKMDVSSTIVLSQANGLNYLRNGENVFAVEVHSRFTDNPDISFDIQIFDKNDYVYYAAGSEWNYYDKGDEPKDKLGNKLTGIENNSGKLFPFYVYLHQNYPNPFNPETEINFDLNKRNNVELKVYNILGQLKEILVNAELEPGRYRYKFDGKNFASGVYFYQLKSGSFVETKKMILMK